MTSQLKPTFPSFSRWGQWDNWQREQGDMCIFWVMFLQESCFSPPPPSPFHGMDLTHDDRRMRTIRQKELQFLDDPGTKLSLPILVFWPISELTCVREINFNLFFRRLYFGAFFITSSSMYILTNHIYLSYLRFSHFSPIRFSLT